MGAEDEMARTDTSLQPPRRPRGPRQAQCDTGPGAWSHSRSGEDAIPVTFHPEARREQQEKTVRFPKGNGLGPSPRIPSLDCSSSRVPPSGLGVPALLSKTFGGSHHWSTELMTTQTPKWPMTGHQDIPAADHAWPDGGFCAVTCASKGGLSHGSELGERNPMCGATSWSSLDSCFLGRRLRV